MLIQFFKISSIVARVTTSDARFSLHSSHEKLPYSITIKGCEAETYDCEFQIHAERNRLTTAHGEQRRAKFLKDAP